MELNTGCTYAPIKELVTTTGGKCPDGYIEVETTMLAPGLRDLLQRLQGQMASADAYALMLVTNLAKRYGAVPEWRPLPDLVGKLTQIDNITAGMVMRSEIDGGGEHG